MEILTYPGLSTVKSYLIKTKKGYILLDPGFPSAVKRILEEHQNIILIVLTHRHYDHHGAAGLARRITGAKIAAYKSKNNNHKIMEVPPLRTFFTRIIYSWFRSGFSLPKWEDWKIQIKMGPADIILKDGDFIDSEKRWQVIYSPGHTSDSICLYSPKEKILFSGDTLINSFGKPKWGKIITDHVASANTRHKLSQLDIRVVYPGHGDKFVVGPKLRKYLFSNPV